jgi:hypothetical protein
LNFIESAPCTGELAAEIGVVDLDIPAQQRPKSSNNDIPG